MIYKSVDTIPSKIFFKILESNDVKLLTDQDLTEDLTIEKLNEIWLKIQNEDAELTNSSKDEKVINISKKIEALLAKMECVNLCVFHLKILKDQDLINQLKKYNYSFTDDLESDIKRVERESEALGLLLKNLKRQLDKVLPKENKKQEVPFDEVVLGYSVVTGLMFKPNAITQSEYRALIKIVNKKIKALDNDN